MENSVENANDSMEGTPTCAYVGSTWSPHLPRVCGTRDSNPGLKFNSH